MATLKLRIDFEPGPAAPCSSPGDGEDGAEICRRAIGPGKIRLLELIEEHGSIAAAARAMDMSYRRAWLLIEDLNRCFREPVLAAHPGGRRGGGATVTAFGRAVVAHYRAMQAEAEAALAPRLVALQAAVAAPGAGGRADSSLTERAEAADLTPKSPAPARDAPLPAPMPDRNCSGRSPRS